MGGINKQEGEGTFQRESEHSSSKGSYNIPVRCSKVYGKRDHKEISVAREVGWGTQLGGLEATVGGPGKSYSGLG